MSVASIFNSASNIAGIAQLFNSQSSGTASQSGAANAGGISSSNDSASVSRFGQFFSELQSLQTSDPTKFKQLMSTEADKLQAAATQAGADTPEGKMLSTMAKKFQDVANGGSPSELLPAASRNSGGAQSTYNQIGQISGSAPQPSQSAGSANSSALQVMQSVFSDLRQAVQS